MKAIIMDLVNVNSLRMTQKMQSFLDVTTLQSNDNGEFETSEIGSAAGSIAMQRKKKRNRSAANIHNGNNSYSYENTA